MVIGYVIVFINGVKKSIKKVCFIRKMGVNLECEVVVVVDFDVDVCYYDKGGWIGGEGELVDVVELFVWGYDLNDGGWLVGVNFGFFNYCCFVGKVFELVGDGLWVFCVD